MSRLPTAPASPDLAQGTLVGDYIIDRKLGEGGMGAVYEAVHPIIDKHVAIKVLRRELCANDEAIARFVQEARAVNRIHHPNIVDVFGFGQTEDGRAFLAMELLAGRALSAWLGKNPERLEHVEICDVLVEVTHALEAAHEAGIVHRDLKPDNIFLAKTRKGIEVKLLDFGIAKLSAGGMHAPVDVTQPGTMIGTPQYIAPEQARSAPLDGRADIYSLGVVAFELFAGRPPFISENPVEMVAKHITLQPPAPSDFDPSLPAALDGLIGAMLEKEPERRPSLAQVREVLGEVRTAPRSAEAEAYEREARRAASTKMILTDDIETVRKPRRLWLWLTIIGLVALGALAARVVLAVLDAKDADDAPPPPVVEPSVTPIAPPPPKVETPQPTPAPEQPAEIANDPVEKAMIEVDPDPAEAKPNTKPDMKPDTKPVKTPAVKTPRTPRRPADTKPTEVKPVETKPTETKPTPPVEPPVKKPEDDDALRSPFDRKKP
jgi:serine/threonine-protein kinase